MFSSDQMIDYIDWFHGPLRGDDEQRDHKGNMISSLLNPKLTIGITNYWNLTLEQHSVKGVWVGKAGLIQFTTETNQQIQTLITRSVDTSVIVKLLQIIWFLMMVRVLEKGFI